MSQVSRRGFLKSSLAVAGGSLLSRRARASSGILGANDRILVAIAGINSSGRGQAHINACLGMKDVEIAYLVDPDMRVWDKSIQRVEKNSGKAPKAVHDIRHALEDKDVHVVSIATPNHWHALMTIWACQAGKDVYVEKPMSHNIHEGRVAVETARKYNRIVQHGTQNRTEGGWGKVVAAIASGKLGKLLIARGLCYKGRDSIGFKEPATPPEGLAFDLWLGPAPEQPYHENLVHYNWHWFWDTGNGDIGNQGVHQMDIARWAIPGATLPKSVISLGGRFGYKDQGQTANTQIAVFDYGETQLIFEVRGLRKDNKYLGEGTSNIFHLEAGVIRGTQFYPADEDKPAPLPEVETARRPGEDHFTNFFRAVRGRDSDHLNAEILEGHYSSALCHLANASYRLGEKVPFNKQVGAFGDNKEAHETLARMEEHLKANGVNLEENSYSLGRKLTIDPKTELTQDEQANKILTGTCRKPFIVPRKAV